MNEFAARRAGGTGTVVPGLQRAVTSKVIRGAGAILSQVQGGSPHGIISEAQTTSLAGQALVQRKVSSHTITSAQSILQQVAPGAGPQVIVVPMSMSVGTATNPALCLKKALQVKWAKDQMMNDKIMSTLDQDPAFLNTWRLMTGKLALNDMLISEGVFDGSVAYKSAVVWHEYGHVIHGATENGNVYLHEVQNLANLIGVEESRSVVTARANAAYKAAVDPGKAQLQAFVQQTWGITV